ncbi:class F sortase [Nocardioides sp. C4-1]|uniref:class F sortase n=1 Tax=Nocardioides sp. C4-1 TaxID=3151851 RepID=UPI003265261C
MASLIARARPAARTTGALVVLVAVLGACGGAPDPAPRTASEAPPTSAAPPVVPPPTSTPSRPAPATPAVPGEPVRVAIAALGLDESLVDLGLDDGGTLEVPDDPARVGWFTGGGRPGGPGPTVVVGHLDSTEGPAVFARLPELGPGDEVVMTSRDGVRSRYVVTQARDVPQDPFPTTEVFGATPDDVLVLITCTGPYDRAAGRYTENRVVTARAA